MQLEFWTHHKVNETKDQKCTLSIQMVCRRRMGMKKMRHVYDGSRPSLECHSIVDSIQLTGVTTFTGEGSKSSFAYYNPALHIGDPNKVK